MVLQGVIADLLWHDWARFYLLPGLLLGVVALFAGWRDRRTMRRKEPDKFGLVNWRSVSFWASFAALLLFAGAVQGWLVG